SAMGHLLGSHGMSRYMTEDCNDLTARIGRVFPDKVSPVCQLPQSPGVSPKSWVEELEHCVKEQGFVACNINPDLAGGGEPFTPSLGAEWWYPLLEKMVELDIPGTIHASASVNPALHTTISYYNAPHQSGAVDVPSPRVFQHIPTLYLSLHQ